MPFDNFCNLLYGTDVQNHYSSDYVLQEQIYLCNNQRFQKIVLRYICTFNVTTLANKRKNKKTI